MESKKKKVLVWSIVSIVSVVLLVVGISYAYLMTLLKQEDVNFLIVIVLKFILKIKIRLL